MDFGQMNVTWQGVSNIYYSHQYIVPQEIALDNY